MTSYVAVEWGVPLQSEVSALGVEVVATPVRPLPQTPQVYQHRNNALPPTRSPLLRLAHRRLTSRDSLSQLALIPVEQAPVWAVVVFD